MNLDYAIPALIKLFPEKAGHNSSEIKKGMFYNNMKLQKPSNNFLTTWKVSFRLQ